MKAKEIYEYLLNNAAERWEKTCDGLIAGDENKEVGKIGTCFKLTARLIDEAAKQGIDMIITHEPTFSQGDVREDAVGVDLKKWELLDKSGIVVYRFHDHAHNTEPDYIHAGFIRALELDIKHKYERESLGICRYGLDGNMTVREFAKRIEEKLGAEFVRVVGALDIPVKTLCLGLGSVGFKQINYLLDPGCDLFVTGEVGEVKVCEYVRDACFFGEEKAVILFGHYSAEYEGMRLLAEELNEKLLTTEYLDSGEVYTRA